MWIVFDTKENRAITLDDVHTGLPKCLAIYASDADARNVVTRLKRLRGDHFEVKTWLDWMTQLGQAGPVA